jgi:hypothetical protein
MKPMAAHTTSMDQVADAIMQTIKSAGFNVGTFSTVDPRTGVVRHACNAIEARTGEGWNVQVEDEYAAAVERAASTGGGAE